MSETEKRITELENKVRRLELRTAKLEALVEKQGEELVELRDQHKSLAQEDRR